MKKIMRSKVGMNSLIVLAGLLNAGVIFFLSRLLKNVTDLALLGDIAGFKEMLVQGVVFLVVVGFIQFFLGFIQSRYVDSVIQLYREKVFNGIFRQRREAFIQTDSAKYISRLTNDLKIVQESYVKLWLQAVIEVISFVGTVLYMFYLSPAITLTMVVLVVLLFMVPMLLGGAMQKRQLSYSEALENLTNRVKEYLLGFEVVESFGIFPYIQKKFLKENQQVYQTNLKLDKMQALVMSLSSVFGLLTQFGVIFVASYFVIRGEITMGTTIALINLSGNFISPLNKLLTSFPQIKSCQPILDKLDGLAAYEPEALGEERKVPTFFKQLTGESIDFGYDQQRDVLENLSVTFEKGKKYALLGKSGCGKTTLVQLLRGDWQNYRGAIKYDGVSLEHLQLDEVRKLSSVIHQNVYLFNESIWENITLGKNFTEAEVKEALVASGAWEFVASLAEGWQMQVGEDGSKLSGGQRQRIAVARALIQKTPLLILDEGTSAIDAKTAYDIENRLLNQKDLSVITITHHLDRDLARQYHEILYLEDGQLVQQGTADELQNRNATLHKMLA